MKLRVLGCAGAELPGFLPPAFLIDDSILFDAGTIGSALYEEEQMLITHIFLTHAHLDHTRGILALVDNIILKNVRHRINVVGIGEVIEALRLHLFNDVIWPDFSRLPSAEEAVLVFNEIEPGQEYRINGYSVTAFPVTHSVPAAGYICRKGKKSGFLYTGDTGPTDTIWRHALDLSTIIAEVSFPDAMEDMALLTGHLTPRLLRRELQKLPELPKRILITHLKPQYSEKIRHELQELRIDQIILLRDSTSYDI